MIFHFVMFRSKTEHNPCLLFSIDATCYFYYTIPALLNGAVILLLLADDITEDFFAGNRIGAKAVFLAAAYFCVFSNLFESVMLAVFCGVRILFSLLKKEKRTFLSLLRENCIRGLVVLAWLISMVYEARGPRAKSLALSEPLSAAAVKSFKNMIARALQCNRAAAVFIAAVLVTAAILLLIRYRKEPLKKRTLAAEVVVNGVLVGIFIVLLCARVGPIRSSRMDVLLSCTFYAFVFLAAAGAYILKTREKSALLLPLLVFILFFECNTRSTTFRESNLFGWTPEQCFAISREIAATSRAQVY